MSIEGLRDYRVERTQAIDPDKRRFELQFRFAVVALRLEINTATPEGECLMMTSRSKAPAPMSIFRAWGFKANNKKAMLKKVEEWAADNGIVLAMRS